MRYYNPEIEALSSTGSITARRDEWIAFAKRFDKLTEDALVRTIDARLLFDLFLYTSQSGKVSFSPECTAAYRQTLYLENPVFSDNFNPDIYDTTNAEINILDNGYRLFFVQLNEIITVDFSDVCLETQLLDYSAVNGSPWSRISDSLTALRHKKDILGMEFLNKKEKALWRLGEFSPIHNIDSQYHSISGDKKADEMFCNFAERAGNNRVAALTRQYSSTNSKEKEKVSKVLIKELKKPESEELARMLLLEIKDAAAEYPTEAELDITYEVLAETRKIVTNIMKQKGYEGEYPHFRKMSSIKGIRLLEIEGQPEFVFNEKNMACMVDCFENNVNFNTLRINCTASTVFLKKDELHMYDSLDGSSGFFSHKHRRRARSLSPNPDFRNDGEVIYDLEGITIAAAKTAACEKLTKDERKNIASVGQGLYGALFYGTLFVLTGVGFGLLFCPAIFLFALLLGALVTFVSSEAPPFSEYFRFLLFDFPWWKMFLFCVAGFGLPMTVFTALSKKRG